MIGYGKQSIDKSDIDAVKNALKNKWLTQGSVVDKFEESLTYFFRSKYACAVSNGTAALHLSGLALGWKPGDIILTSPITFVATSNSVLYCGATPDFVDIDSTTFTIDPNLLEDKIKSYRLANKIVKAVIGVDFAGHPCDWESLKFLADKYQFKLINDNCHAMGASYKDDNHYAVKYADVVTQSFHPVKHITTGEGGAIISNDVNFIDKVKMLRSHGNVAENEKLEKNEGPWYYEMHELGFNYRITDFQCALGISQLKRLESFISKRIEIASKYNSAFTNYDFIKIPKVLQNIKHAYHLYPLRINFIKSKISKKDFFNFMFDEGFRLQVHYIPIYHHPFYREKFGYNPKDFKASEKFYSEEVSLPIFPGLTPEDLNKVVDLISLKFK